jgi:hypothetical protein
MGPAYPDLAVARASWQRCHALMGPPRPR